MKNVILVAIAAIALVATSCTKEVCVTCKVLGDDTRVESQCGTSSEAKEFIDDHKNMSSSSMYSSTEWVCTKQKFK